MAAMFGYGGEPTRPLEPANERVLALRVAGPASRAADGNWAPFFEVVVVGVLLKPTTTTTILLLLLLLMIIIIIINIMIAPIQINSPVR